MDPTAPLILVVDDDDDFLEITRRVLEGEGYRVVCACDPAAAVGEMEREKPSLAITDLMMQALGSGFSLSQRIKDDTRFRDVPVVIVTAVGSSLQYDFTPRGPADLAAMGADAFFDKPVEPKALLAKVRELLGRGDAETVQ